MKKIAVYLSAKQEGGGFFQYAETLLEALAESSLSEHAEILCWYRGDYWGKRLDTLGLNGRSASRFDSVFARLRNSFLKRCLRLLHASDPLLLRRADVENRLLADWDPDLIINVQPSFFIPVRPVPQVAPVHDLMHLFESSFPEVGTKEELAFRDTLYAGICRYCSTILVDSELGKEHVMRHYGARDEQFLVLPYAAPATLGECEPQRPRGLFVENFLFYPAQFWEHKNHIRLLEALKLAQGKCPDLHCVFTGSTRHGGYAPFVTALGELGLENSVSVLGYVDVAEISWLYRHARGLVMPTFFGPTNIPPLEAMALGCPVAVSDIYAMREQCGDAALYFNPLDVNGMAKIMADLWSNEDLRRILREKGLTRHAAWNSGCMKQLFVQKIRKELGLQNAGRIDNPYAQLRTTP